MADAEQDIADCFLWRVLETGEYPYMVRNL